MSYDPIYEAISAGQSVVFQVHANGQDGFMTFGTAGVVPGEGFMVEAFSIAIVFTNGSYHTTA